MSDHPIYPHGPLVELTPGLWQLKGSLPFPLPRNMTVVRLASGGLLLHSVIALNEDGLRALEALGKPEVMVVPHPFHLMDAPFYKARYPGLKVVAAEDAEQKLAGKVTIDGRPQAILPAVGIRFELPPGMKVQEIVLDLDVAGGRALVFTDLFGTGIPGLFGKLLGAPGGVGVARIVKMRQITDRPAVRAYLAKKAEATDLKLILVAHGEPLQVGCAEALRRAAERV